MKKWHRWHRYIDGTKIIKNFPTNEIPIGWTRGTGPFDTETLNKLCAMNQNLWKGVPKSTEQKQKMRLAKLGKPKSDSHKQNLKKAWETRKNQNSSNNLNQTSNG
jgi:hypothetical protein